MKVYLSNYRDHWISPYTILQRVCFWRVVPTDDDDEHASDEHEAEREERGETAHRVSTHGASDSLPCGVDPALGR